MAVTTDPVVTEDGARTLPPPRLQAGKVRRPLVIIVCLLGLGLGYLFFRFGQDALVAYRQGFFDKTEQKKYDGTSEQNLKAIYTALSLYHDSEGQFPQASGWMDAIRNRLQTADLQPGEGEKKLRRPGVENGLGYALNDTASAKYKADIDPKTILVFESKATEPNAHGKPQPGELAAKGTALAVTADGTIVRY